MPKTSTTVPDPELLDAVRHLVLQARALVEGPRVGDNQSPFQGFSIEFRQHRPYVPGDDVKHIDWRVYARNERYVVKQYTQFSNYHGHILLDASASMAFGRGRAVPKLEYARRMAVCLAFLMIRGRNPVSLGVFDRQLSTYIPPSARADQVTRIASACAACGAGESSAIGAVLDDFSRRLTRRGVVIVLSDLFDDAQAVLAGIRRLAFAGHDVILFHILDRQEREFPFDGQYRFQALEGDQNLRCRPRELKVLYLRRLRAFIETLRRGAEDAGADFVPVTTDVPVPSTLASYVSSRRASRRWSS